MEDKLYLTLFNNHKNWEDIICLLSEGDQKYINQGQSKITTLISLVLIKTAMRELNYNYDNISRNITGKPIILPPNKHKYISISHSHNLIACLVSDQGEVGLDIEYIAEYNDELARIFMTKGEYDSINADPINSHFLFNKYWTMKEAHYKVSDTNDLEDSITVDFSKITDSIMIKDKQHHVHSARFSKWWLSIVADHSIPAPDITVYTEEYLYKLCTMNI